MDETILIDLMVQMAGLEAERDQCRNALAQDAVDLAKLAALGEEYSADAGEASACLSEAAATERRIEAELEALEARLARSRVRLAASTVARETQALEQEIAGLEARQESLMAEACNLLENLQEKDRAADAAGSERQDHERRAADRLQEIQARQVKLEAALPTLENEIQRLVAAAPDAVTRHLVRLWAKDMTATVYERDGACAGCGAQLRPQQALAVQHGKELVRCPACARFVVHRPWG